LLHLRLLPGLEGAHCAAQRGERGRTGGVVGSCWRRRRDRGADLLHWPLRQLAGRGLPKARRQGGTCPWLTAALGAHLHVRACHRCCLRLPRRRQVVACERSSRDAVRVCKGCAAHSRQTAALVGRAHPYCGAPPLHCWAFGAHRHGSGGADADGNAGTHVMKEENMAICGSRVSRCAVQLQSGAAALRQPKSLDFVCIIRRPLLAPGHAQCLEQTRELVKGSASPA